MSSFPRAVVRAKRRSAKTEKFATEANFIEQVVQLRELAEQGGTRQNKSASEYVLIAHALIDCPLPFRPTEERQVSRRTRSLGSFVTVTYTATRPGIPLPTASDGRLLHWLINKVIQQWLRTKEENRKPERHVGWNSAYEYLHAVGKTICSKNYEDLRSSFSRISGLSITIEVGDGRKGRNMPFVDSWELPPSLDSSTGTPALEPGAGYGVVLSEAVLNAAVEHFAAIPVIVWRMLKGRPQRGAFLLWAFKRAYTTMSSSIIPWDLLRAQFGVTDSNPRRLKQAMAETSIILRTMWPASRMHVTDEGVSFSRSLQSFIPHDTRES